MIGISAIVCVCFHSLPLSSEQATSSEGCPGSHSITVHILSTSLDPQAYDNADC